MYSVELQKPAAGQPTISDVLDLVLKECKKENLVYKMAALRSAADILESTQTDRFQDITSVVLPLIRKVQLTTYVQKPLIFGISALLIDNGTVLVNKILIAFDLINVF